MIDGLWNFPQAEPRLPDNLSIYVLRQRATLVVWLLFYLEDTGWWLSLSHALIADCHATSLFNARR